MEEDFRDKNLVKKGSAFEYNVLDDNGGDSADQVPIEFVPMETTTRKGREGKKILSKGGETTKAGGGETNKVRSNDKTVPSPRKRLVTKKKLKLGGGFVSKGFRGSTSARSDYHNVTITILCSMIFCQGLPCFNLSKHVSKETLLQCLPR